MTLTLVMAVFGQPKILRHQLETFVSYGDDVLEQLKIIIVDDHGDPPVAIPDEFKVLLDIEVHRVLKNIPWNQMGARNIGMREASGWCVMLDPDMVIEKEMIGKFLAVARGLQRGTVVKFGLRHGNPLKKRHPKDDTDPRWFIEGKIEYSSPNTWLIHKDDFFHAGGYDEDFAGHKGWSDCLLQETLRSFFRVIDNKDLYVSFHLPSDGYADAMVLSLNRDVEHNRRLKQKKSELISKMGGFKRYISRGLKGKNFRCPSKKII